MTTFLLSVTSLNFKSSLEGIQGSDMGCIGKKHSMVFVFYFPPISLTDDWSKKKMKTSREGKCYEVGYLLDKKSILF